MARVVSLRLLWRSNDPAMLRNFTFNFERLESTWEQSYPKPYGSDIEVTFSNQRNVVHFRAHFLNFEWSFVRKATLLMLIAMIIEELTGRSESACIQIGRRRRRHLRLSCLRWTECQFWPERQCCLYLFRQYKVSISSRRENGSERNAGGNAYEETFKSLHHILILLRLRIFFLLRTHFLF